MTPAAAPAAPQQHANQASGRAAQPLVPFPQASRRAIEQPLSFTVTPGTAPITLGPADLTPNGFLRFVDVHVRTVTAGTLGTGVAAAGFPFTILQNLQFIDTGGQKMDDLSGYALFVDNYTSGSPFRGDPTAAYDYSANPISPNFRLRIARELFPDGRGALPNLSGSQKYRVRLVIEALANIYSTAPTTAPTLAVDIIDHLWLLPAPFDGGQRPQQRRPPLLGLAQYRTSFYPSISITSAQVSQQIKATGNLIKYIAFIARDNTGAFNDLVFPDPFTLRVDNSYPFDNVPLSEVIHAYESKIPERTSRLPGVVILPFNDGLERTVGGNGVSSWLPTSTATYILLQGRQATPTVGTIDILVCEISTAEIDPAERSAMNNGTGTWQPAIPQTVQGGV
ncbi:MAG TPA: hypothetical protein VFP55_13635 [Solirubrobacteraceae bacterium]|nr:hypothetical protein [Solirubrobacteraceae bacterium]